MDCRASGRLRGMLLAGVTGGAALVAGPAWAQTKVFDVPAQSAATGVSRFARQADAQVLISATDADGRRTNSVRGAYSVSRGLSVLLAGTGLTAQATGDSTWTVVAAPASGLGVSDVGAAPEPAVVEDVVVTAQKRAERLIDVPQSISVLSSDAIEKLAATQFRDFANTVPGLSFTTMGAGVTTITLRGVATSTDSPTVGVYVDDVPYGSSSGFATAAGLALDVGLFGVERIEVLRGPQGTLYGASSMGGVLKYVTRRPDISGFGGEAQAGVSATHDGGLGYNGALTLNAPLGSSAAIRVGGYYARDGGYIDNLTLGEKNVDRAKIYGARADLLFAPAEDLEVRLAAFVQDIRRDGSAMADYTLAGDPVGGSLNQRNPLLDSFEQKFRLVSATVERDLGGAALTSITSYQTSRVAWLVDRSGALAPILGSIGFPMASVGLEATPRTRKFTQETRIASDPGGRLEWLAGGYYTHESSGGLNTIRGRDAAGQVSPLDIFTLSYPSTYEELAAFGNLTVRLSPRLDVTGGVRYAHNRQSFANIGSGLFGSSNPEQDSKEDVFTWLANARYRLSDNATAYVRYATGYRPGGPNYVVIDPATGQSIGPTTFESDGLKSYEAGLRAETADRRFGVDAAIYHIDWSDIQIVAVRNGFGVYENAGGARIRGAEVALTARPAAGLVATAALAWQDAQLSDADADLGGRAGERLPGVPKFTASLSVDYRLPAGGSLEPSLGATLRHVSDRTATFDASTSGPQYRFPAYTTLDLRAGVVIRDVQAQLYVRNVFDERPQQSAFLFSASTVGAGSISVAILQPRTVGVTLSRRF